MVCGLCLFIVYQICFLLGRDKQTGENHRIKITGMRSSKKTVQKYSEPANGYGNSLPQVFRSG